MVRLMLVLAPVMCILAGIGVSATLHTYMKNLDPLFKKETVAMQKKPARKTVAELNYPIKNEVSAKLKAVISCHLPAILTMCACAMLIRQPFCVAYLPVDLDSFGVVFYCGDFLVKLLQKSLIVRYLLFVQDLILHLDYCCWKKLLHNIRKLAK